MGPPDRYPRAPHLTTILAALTLALIASSARGMPPRQAKPAAADPLPPSKGAQLVQQLGELDRAHGKRRPPRRNPIRGVELMMRAPLARVGAIAELGFLNLFQTGSSGGEKNQILIRFLAEKQLLGKRDLPFYPLSERFRYGYLNVQGVNQRLPDPWEYGEVTFIFKPELAERTSFYMGDSLFLTAGGFAGKMYRARPVADRDTLYNVLKGFEYDPRLDGGRGFVEAEYHGGPLSLEDVQAVVLPKALVAWPPTKEKEKERAELLQTTRKQVLTLARQYGFDVYLEEKGQFDRPVNPRVRQTSPSGRELIYQAPRGHRGQRFVPPGVDELLQRARRRGIGREELIPLMAVLAERATSDADRRHVLSFLKSKTNPGHDKRVRQYATLFLGHFQGPRVVEHLAGLLADERAEVRQSAVVALTNQPASPQTRDLLCSAAGCGDPMVGMTLALELGKVPGKRAANALLTIAKNAAANFGKLQRHCYQPSTHPEGWAYFCAFEGALARQDLPLARSIMGLLGTFERRDWVRPAMQEAITRVERGQAPAGQADGFYFLESLHHWAKEGKY